MAVITGVTGQTGSYMAEFLLKRGLKVIGATRRTSQLIDSNLEDIKDHPNFELKHFDLTDAHSINNLVKETSPDYIINFGAQTFVADSWNNPYEHFETNAGGVLHFLEAVKNHAPNCRFYSSGTSEQYGDVQYSPQDINHPFSPRSPYGVAKCAANHFVKVYRESYGLYAVHGVCFNHESPRRQDYFVTRKVTRAACEIKQAILRHDPDSNTKFPVLRLGNLDAKRDWSHALDFVEGIWLMLNQEKPKDYVLSSGETCTIRDFVTRAFNTLAIGGYWSGGGEKEVFVSSENPFPTRSPLHLVKVDPKFYRPAEVELLQGDSSPIRTELGWEPKYDLDKLVGEMVSQDWIDLRGL